MVISVSRRCDIPRFAFKWFLERINEGFVDVRNPFNANQVKRVTLLPPLGTGLLSQELPSTGDKAEVFAFWTRDPASILENSETLERLGYGFYVMISITAYPAVLEPNAPPANEIIQKMGNLAKKITADRVIWRYDPLFLSSITDFDFHRRNFAGIATRLNGTVNRVILSVYDPYPRAEKRLAALERKGILERTFHNQPELPHELQPEFRSLLSELACIARREGMEIQSCAEDLSDCGIKSGACIDWEYLGKVFGSINPGLAALKKDPGQRGRCLCAESTDIGSYGSCPAGCVYCYAS